MHFSHSVVSLKSVKWFFLKCFKIYSSRFLILLACLAAGVLAAQAKVESDSGMFTRCVFSVLGSVSVYRASALAAQAYVESDLCIFTRCEISILGSISVYQKNVLAAQA